MKTFKEFLDEAFSYHKHPHFSNKGDLEKHYGGMPDWAYAKNRGTKENPKWGLASKASREKSSNKREEDIKMTTGKLSPREQHKVSVKRRLAKKRGMEVHHSTEIEKSAKEMRDMSPGGRLRHKSKERIQHRYSGDDPRNLVLADRSDISNFSPHKPGFHHSAYHAFERRHRKDLEDISNAIEPRRAFTTLVNQARRRKRRLPELQARMARAAERHGITND